MAADKVYEDLDLSINLFLHRIEQIQIDVEHSEDH